MIVKKKRIDGNRRRNLGTITIIAEILPQNVYVVHEDIGFVSRGCFRWKKKMGKNG